MKIGSINEDRFWLIIYVYIPLALIGIFFSGSLITPSYYTLIFLGIVPFLFLCLNKRIVMGNVKKSFLYSLPLLWPFAVELIYVLYKYGSEVPSHWQWPVDPSTLSFWGIFDKYLWHPFVIFSFSWNLFFLEIVQPAIQRRIGKKWAIPATTCVWTAWFFSLGFFCWWCTRKLYGHNWINSHAVFSLPDVLLCLL